MFNLKAENNEIILTSETYKTKQMCEHGIEVVKERSVIGNAYHTFINEADNKYHFNLKGANGEIIGQSEIYEQKEGMENGIQSVMFNAPYAAIKDKTSWLSTFFTW